MTVQTVEPTAVYNPPRNQSTYNTYNTRTAGGNTAGGRQRGPQTRLQAPRNTAQQRQQRINRGVSDRLAGSLARGAVNAEVPAGLPKILGDSQLIILAWIGALAVISWDEWHKHHVLPRPSRLWFTTLVYGILSLMGMVPGLAPLANIMAIGYTIVLVWQYFNKNGQFA